MTYVFVRIRQPYDSVAALKVQIPEVLQVKPGPSNTSQVQRGQLSRQLDDRSVPGTRPRAGESQAEQRDIPGEEARKER